MTFAEVLFIIADLWLIVAGLSFGWKFIRNYKNYFLGLECLVVAVSATNFLFWSILSGEIDSPMYTVAYFLDAFSRSFGFTLVLILGLMMVTHRYRPALWHEIGAFALAAIGGAFFVGFHGGGAYGAGPATFFMITNVIASAFLFYFAARVWRAGAKGWAVATALITLVAMLIALTYDFLPWPFDDANRTLFYSAALATWGTQGLVYYFGYRALYNDNARADVVRAQKARVTS